MNTSTPMIRLGLLALTGAIVLGTAALRANPETIATSRVAASLPTTTLATITVRPAEGDFDSSAAANATPVLPAIRVSASEEEILAARLDPTDRIQILSTITVRPGAEEVAAAMSAPALAETDSDDNPDFGDTLTRAVVEHRGLRLDMPYYSFGKVLTRASK